MHGPMNLSKGRVVHCLLLLAGVPFCVDAQVDSLLLIADDMVVGEDSMYDNTAAIEDYEPLNAALGGDSVRLCNGYGCIGWVEDHYPDGTLKHRGYYKDGQLLVYRNYHPTGQLEREFKVMDNIHCFLRTYHDNGTVRTEVSYTRGSALSYSDHYHNGQIRYHEEKHPTLPYYMVMDLFAPDGKPISTLHLVDKKKAVFEQREYWSNGNLKCTGKAQYNPTRYDTQRVGNWTVYDASGRATREERYIDGKVHETVQL